MKPAAPDDPGRPVAFSDRRDDQTVAERRGFHQPSRPPLTARASWFVWAPGGVLPPGLTFGSALGPAVPSSHRYVPLMVSPLPNDSVPGLLPGEMVPPLATVTGPVTVPTPDRVPP